MNWKLILGLVLVVVVLGGITIYFVFGPPSKSSLQELQEAEKAAIQTEDPLAR